MSIIIILFIRRLLKSWIGSKERLRYFQLWNCRQIRQISYLDVLGINVEVDINDILDGCLISGSHSFKKTADLLENLPRLLVPEQKIEMTHGNARLL